MKESVEIHIARITADELGRLGKIISPVAMKKNYGLKTRVTNDSTYVVDLHQLPDKRILNEVLWAARQVVENDRITIHQW